MPYRTGFRPGLFADQTLFIPGGGSGSFLFDPPEPRNVNVFDGFHREEPPQILGQEPGCALQTSTLAVLD